jgi:hypothetical protein
LAARNQPIIEQAINQSAIGSQKSANHRTSHQPISEQQQQQQQQQQSKQGSIFDFAQLTSNEDPMNIQ